MLGQLFTLINSFFIPFISKINRNGATGAVNFELAISLFSSLSADAQSVLRSSLKIWISFSIWDFLASGGEENQIKNKIDAIMQENDYIKGCNFLIAFKYEWLE